MEAWEIKFKVLGITVEMRIVLRRSLETLRFRKLECDFFFFLSVLLPLQGREEKRKGASNLP